MRGTLLNYYEQFVAEAIVPDLLGKAVHVTSYQFPLIYDSVQRMSSLLNIVPPDVYVMESLYYDVNAEGYRNPWLQITAKTIYDFPKPELDFLIARQLIHLQCGHMYYEVLMEQTSKAFDFLKQTPAGLLNVVGGIDAAQMTQRLVMAKWSRISELTADAGAYLLSAGNISDCVNAILSTIFNSRALAKEINIREYIKQSSQINARNSTMANFSKMDELMPYGPFRIQELIKYVSSPRSKAFANNYKPKPIAKSMVLS